MSQLGRGFAPTQAPGLGGGGHGASPRNLSAVSDTRTLRTLTIKQVTDAEAGAAARSDGGNLRVDEHVVDQIYLVGKLVEVRREPDSFMLMMRVDDGTGSILLQRPVETNHEIMVALKLAELHLGLQHADRDAYLANYVRPVDNHNEVTYHQLSCIFQHVHIARQNEAARAAAQAAFIGSGLGTPVAPQREQPWTAHPREWWSQPVNSHRGPSQPSSFQPGLSPTDGRAGGRAPPPQTPQVQRSAGTAKRTAAMHVWAGHQQS
ncbi:hypothetical protein ABPG77_004405 [Micractinium sp. CCAP 211/92]